jgi:excisionase family DNA binding protein
VGICGLDGAGTVLLPCLVIPSVICAEIMGEGEEGMNMARPKEILTTGQVAEICKVAPRTVTKWFDSGRLKGYKIPGSRDRRIPLAELLRFMREYSIPTDQLEITGGDRALIIAEDGQVRQSLLERLKDRFDVEVACSSFDAGLMIPRFLPNTVFISLLSPNIDACAICHNIRSNNELAGIRVVAVADHLSESEIAALVKKGFDGCLSSQTSVSDVLYGKEQITRQLA